MRKVVLIAGILAALLLGRAVAAETQLPPFLPNYYTPAFEVRGKQLLLVNHKSKRGYKRYAYATADRSVALLLENIECDQSSCAEIFRNILGRANERLTRSRGEFHMVSERDIFSQLRKKAQNEFAFVYVLPASILIWNFETKSDDALSAETKFETIRGLVNRHRYEVAKALGNVAMGAWGAEAHAYARQLLQEGKTGEGLAVLRDVLVTSPVNYDAHVDLIDHSKDPAANRTSAEIVFKNAERRELIDRAAEVLGVSRVTLDSIPLLKKNESGLQVILIPLSPVNPWLLDQTAKTYEEITDIPVKIRRLKEQWQFAEPDRFYRERDIQRVLISLRNGNLDFAGWNKARYSSELLKAVESADALSRYQAKDLVGAIDRLPGQYRVDAVLDWLSESVQEYRSDDIRTMYVGITEANIFAGDSNYVFSSGIPEDKSPVSVLSYSMMLAKTLSENYESRQRLTERIAKELVPASLKLLKIPRPADPTDPYSYSSGVARLDQKTLVLSEPVKDALKKFRSN